jgi:hypothetical protein
VVQRVHRCRRVVDARRERLVRARTGAARHEGRRRPGPGRAAPAGPGGAAGAGPVPTTPLRRLRPPGAGSHRVTAGRGGLDGDRERASGASSQSSSPG